MTPQNVDEAPQEDQLPVEPVLPFVTRSGLGEHRLGQATRRAKVLEVNQLWEDVLVDTRHFRLTRDDTVSVGADLGHRWRFLGIDMGWVSRPLATVLPLAMPMWSEVTTEWRGDFHAPDHALPLRQDHELFVREGQHYEARVLRGWEGFAVVNGEALPLEELEAAGLATQRGDELVIPMVDGMRLYLELDGVGFYAHLVYEGTPLVSRGQGAVDYPLVAVGSLAAFVGMLFGLVVMFAPAPPKNELVQVPECILQLLVEPPAVEEEVVKAPEASDPDAGEGSKAKEDEGTRGKKDATIAKAKGDPSDVAKRELDRQVADQAGVLGALQEAGMMDGMFGSSSLDAGLAAQVGGLMGVKGTQVGSHGLGSRGSGLGNGGDAEGGAGVGTNGLGGGRTGYGSEGGIHGAKQDGGISGGGGGTIVLGSLDRGLIDEVIKRNMSQIRYCYQRELTKHPSLGGKVVIKFTIAGDGTVAAASTKSTSMHHEPVESCMVGRFLRMQFPSPQGGGIVVVSYPFIFSQG